MTRNINNKCKICKEHIGNFKDKDNIGICKECQDSIDGEIHRR